jgi:hypothetical protein
MAINVDIFNNSTNSTKRISVEFFGNILASSSGVDSGSTTYYFNVSTSAKDTGNNRIPNSVVEGLDSLVLNGSKQRMSDTSAPYSSITDMIDDYIYDYVNGHSEDLHSSGVSERLPLKF